MEHAATLVEAACLVASALPDDKMAIALQDISLIPTQLISKSLEANDRTSLMRGISMMVSLVKAIHDQPDSVIKKCFLPIF